MGSVYEVVRVSPGSAYMQWVSIMFLLVAMSTMGRGFVETEEYISDLDMPIPTAHISGVFGKKASLPCDTQPLSADDRLMMVLWFKEADWEPLYSYDVRGRSTNLPKLWSSPNGFGSRAFFRATAIPATLLIDNVTTTDTGVYRCRVDFKNSPTRNLRVNFTVICINCDPKQAAEAASRSPELTVPPNRPIIMDAKTKDHTRLLEPYNEGDTLELLCVVNGALTDGNCSLRTHTYTHNGVGEFVASLSGHTTYSFIDKLGAQNAWLICGDPRPSLIWYLENTIIDDSYEQKEDGVTLNTLTFPNIGRQHLNLRLICQASNTNLAPPQSKLLILDIYLRPLVVQILNKNRQLSADRSYEVECKTTGSRPEAQVTWWKGTLPLRKSTRSYSDTNTTTSILEFVPEAENHDLQLTCRAENPRVENSVIEDTWRLNVHYVPIVDLKMGSNLNPTDIKEGDDVYFECNVRANPKATKLSWIKNSEEIQQNASSGIILSEQSLVLQSVDRGASGDYMCLAQNSEGSASSNPVSLQVRYSPVCKSEEGQAWSASRLEPIELSCVVDSSPQPTSFEWAFNRNSDHRELPPSLYTVSGHTSILRYIPSEDRDFGTLTCRATNAAGRQEIPCTYNLVSVDRPTSLQNCSIVNQSKNSILVDCLEGFDGGAQQVFTMEVVELPSLIVRANITSNTTPCFEVIGLDRGLSYALNLFATNSKGQSEVVTIYTVASRSLDKYTGSAFSLTPLTASLLAAAGMLVAAAAVSVAIYRRNSTVRHAKQPVAPLYSEDSLVSLPKRDNLPSYTPSQKVDYSAHYELKINSDAEDDPDIIPVYYDKKKIDDCCKSEVGEGDTITVYRPQAVSLPNNGNVTFVNRGVTARGRDLRVRESCI